MRKTLLNRINLELSCFRNKESIFPFFLFFLFHFPLSFVIAFKDDELAAFRNATFAIFRCNFEVAWDFEKVFQTHSVGLIQNSACLIIFFLQKGNFCLNKKKFSSNFSSRDRVTIIIVLLIETIIFA